MTRRQPVREYLTSTLVVVSSWTASQIALTSGTSRCLCEVREIKGSAHYPRYPLISCKGCSAKGGSLICEGLAAPCCQALKGPGGIAARRPFSRHMALVRNAHVRCCRLAKGMLLLSWTRQAKLISRDLARTCAADMEYKIYGCYLSACWITKVTRESVRLILGLTSALFR